MTSTSLPDTLDDLRRRFAPSYGDGLTNHMPMVAIALDRLAGPVGPGPWETLRGVVDAHAARLEPARPWPAAQVLALEMQERGVDVVLREHLKRHLLGLAGAAFHGIIRLAYATLSKDVTEIAHALAYLEETSLPLEVSAEGATTSALTNELTDLVDALRAARIPKPTGANITVRIEQVVADQRFVDVVRRLVVDQSTLRQVSGLGARWYLAADDFPSLHVLTGSHALRILRPWTSDERAADRALATAALACFVVCGSPERADARNRDKAEDKELKKHALASTDDHMAKLVVAALDEEAAHEDVIYRIVATRAARRGHT